MRRLAAALIVLAFWAIPARYGSAEPESSLDPALDLSPVDGVLSTAADCSPGYSHHEVYRWMLNLMQPVEEITGRRFQSIPQLEILRLDRVAQAALDDPERDAGGDGPDLSALIKGHDARSLRALMGLPLGLYLGDRDTILIKPGCWDLVAAPAVDDRTLVKFMLAHELSHALQDQHLDLSSQGATLAMEQDLDRLLAFRAVLEGHAQLVAEIVGHALGIRDPAADLPSDLVLDQLEIRRSDDSPLQLASQAILESIYADGLRFARQQFETGGHTQLWTILDSPPTRTAEITRPEAYRPGRPPGPKLGQALDGLESQLSTGARWKVDGPYRVGQLLVEVLFDLERIHSTGLETGVWSRARSDGGLELDLTGFRVMEPAHVGQLAKALETNVLAQPEARGATEQRLPVGGAESSIARRFVIPDPGDPDNVRELLWVSRGTLLIALDYRGPELTSAAIWRYVDATFEALARVL